MKAVLWDRQWRYVVAEAAHPMAPAVVVDIYSGDVQPPASAPLALPAVGSFLAHSEPDDWTEIAGNPEAERLARLAYPEGLVQPTA